MSSFTEIESAVDALPREQKDELLVFLAARLRGVEPPPPREYSVEQIESWIKDDEEGMLLLRERAAKGGRA